MKTFVLGITGVIGSGKSTVCEILKKQGFLVINADQITRELYKKDQPGYAKIRDYFGDTYVGKEEVSRPKLRSLVLSNHQKMWILNTVIHPLIVNEVYKKIDQLKKIENETNGGKTETLRVALEAFYFEQRDLGKLVNEIIRIDAADAVIEARLKKNQPERELPAKDLQKWLLYQRKILSEVPVSYVNDGTVEELEQWLKPYLEKNLS